MNWKEIKAEIRESNSVFIILIFDYQIYGTFTKQSEFIPKNHNSVLYIKMVIKIPAG